MNDHSPKRKIFTRRRFLWAGGSVLAAGGLGIGGFVFHDRRQRFGREATAIIPDHRSLKSSCLSNSRSLSSATSLSTENSRSTTRLRRLHDR